MRLTFSRLVQDAIDATIDERSSSTNGVTNPKLYLKRQINYSVSEINSMLSNHKTKPTEVTASTTASQVYYSYPPGLNQVDTCTLTVGSVAYPLQVISSQAQWDVLQAVSYSSTTTPLFIFPRQHDYGIYPTPQDAYTITFNGYYEPVNMTADDYNTGTVSLTQNSQTVTGSGTTFTSSMVGRWFCLVDSTESEPKGNWYKITGYTSATSITLMSYYEASTVSGENFIIGESPELPEEIHQHIPLHAAANYMLTKRRDPLKARRFMNMAMTGNPENDSRDKSIKQGIQGVINKYALGGRSASQIVRMDKFSYGRFNEAWTTTLTGDNFGN